MNAAHAAPYVFAIIAVTLIAPMALMAPFVSLMSADHKNIILAAAIFFGFIAMALLLPDFDGRTDEDWDCQGRDDLWKN